MYRNAMADLIEWKEQAHRKPLVVNGARQVGKTWLVTEFGRQQFDAVAHVIFLENEEMQKAFDASLNPKRLLTLIGAFTGTSPIDGNTLVFLDEIQECPRAITSLKLFYEQCPEIPIVAAGSLLGVALNRSGKKGQSPASWPVGKVDFLNLYPMTFDEFLRGVGEDAVADILEASDFTMIDALHETLASHLKTYFFVGGMPEAVQLWADTQDFNSVRKAQENLLSGYERDFAKHVESPHQIERIRQTWKSIPAQIAREGDLKRFVYSSIAADARGRDYRDAISWLDDAGLITKVMKVSKPGIPLTAYADDTYFKLYLLDIGLLGAATSMDARILTQGDKMFTEYKGAYAEQYVCQQLVVKLQKAPFYWSADGKKSKGEVDFIIERAGAVLPIEVKAEKNYKGSSLASFVEKYGIDRAVRFSMGGYKDQGWLLNVPLFAADSPFLHLF